MNKKEILDKLQKLNLTEYESKVYYALCQLDHPSASDISTVSKVPRSKVYDVLRSLSERGLIKEVAGNIKRFSVLEPSYGFKFLNDEIESEFNKKKKIHDEMASFFEKFVQENNRNENQIEQLKIIRKKEAIINNIENLAKQAHEEILFFYKGPYFIPMTDKQLGIRPLQRGIVVRSIYEESDLTNPVFRRLLIKFYKRGEQIRIAKTLPVKLAVADHRDVVFALVNKISEDINFTGVVVNHSDLAVVFKIVFEHYWNLAIPLEEYFNQHNYLLK